MKKRSRPFIGLAIGVATLTSSLLIFPVFAEPGEFELNGSLIWGMPAINVKYSNRFAPLYPSPPYTSSAGQTLNIQGQGALGLAVCLNYFPVPFLGFQVLGDYFKPSLGGRNSSYDLSLRYTYSLPPGSPPREATYQEAQEWGDTRGDLTQVSFSFNGILRFRLGPLFRFSFSGGPSYYSVKGQASHFGYTKFSWGADGLLHILTYKLVGDFGPANGWGFNAGAGLALDLTRNIEIFMEFRYYRFSQVSLDIRIRPDDNITEPMAEIENTMNLKPLAFDPSYYRIGLGFKVGI